MQVSQTGEKKSMKNKILLKWICKTQIPYHFKCWFWKIQFILIWAVLQFNLETVHLWWWCIDSRKSIEIDLSTFNIPNPFKFAHELNSSTFGISNVRSCATLNANCWRLFFAFHLFGENKKRRKNILETFCHIQTFTSIFYDFSCQSVPCYFSKVF